MISQRTSDTSGPVAKDVGLDHRRGDIAVPRSSGTVRMVVSAIAQMGGEEIAEESLYIEVALREPEAKVEGLTLFALLYAPVRARAGSGSERASEARSNEIEGLPPRLVPPDVVSALEQKERPTSSGRVGSRQRKIESLALPAPPCPRRFSVGPAYWRHFSSTRQLGSSSQPFAEANVCADTG